MMPVVVTIHAHSFSLSACAYCGSIHRMRREKEKVNSGRAIQCSIIDVINHFAEGLDCPMSILFGRLATIFSSSRLSNDIYFESVCVYDICTCGCSFLLMLIWHTEKRQFLKSTSIQRTLMNDSIVNFFPALYPPSTLSLFPKSLPMKIG